MSNIQSFGRSCDQVSEQWLDWAGVAHQSTRWSCVSSFLYLIVSFFEGQYIWMHTNLLRSHLENKPGIRSARDRGLNPTVESHKPGIRSARDRGLNPTVCLEMYAFKGTRHPFALRFVLIETKPYFWMVIVNGHFEWSCSHAWLSIQINVKIGGMSL